MTDDLRIRRPRHCTRIDTGDEDEVRYWTAALHCTKEELNAAVEYLARQEGRRRRDLQARGAWVARARLRAGGRVLRGRY